MTKKTPRRTFVQLCIFPSLSRWNLNGARGLIYYFQLVLLFIFSCSSPNKNNSSQPITHNPKHEIPFIVVLGIAQDAGYPHAGCDKECCAKYYNGKEGKKLVSCLALVLPYSKQKFLFDCTPDFPAQLHLLDSICPSEEKLSGIFLTHAHMGHYTGLLHLGREAMNTHGIKLYCMPRMMNLLQNNGPWSQLVSLQNVNLMPLKEDTTVFLPENISVTPFTVPHRDEFSETVGYKISSGKKNIIFIPDIDKWEKWSTDIVQLVKENDILFLDGTFYKDGELKNRSMKEVPHPFITESMLLFEKLSSEEKKKIFFIHLNHTNPALEEDGKSQKEIEQRGFSVAKLLQVEEL